MVSLCLWIIERKLLRDNRGIRHKLQAYPLSQLLLLLNPQKDFAEFFVPPPSIVDDFGLAMVIVVVVDACTCGLHLYTRPPLGKEYGFLVSECTVVAGGYTVGSIVGSAGSLGHHHTFTNPINSNTAPILGFNELVIVPATIKLKDGILVKGVIDPFVDGDEYINNDQDLVETVE
ncbi:hypothetical protein L6452_38588 [Arctium lappa]|uniref:Uncharacterized protein n=1 Tax=Arctium lappa TaxID=4217 RepID=A0ACB8XR42_ARCLA|nr:hypothetical protein L6452_38588 [Arctium lappa]